ncbi:hypothetical protein PtrM4_031180 [Pyrenophora tritici-repentis]|uniref:Velvet domain-containing protein n=1 Tax=Pyrenophora tritici-repentis TaxID=45151 RepID=A0A834SAB1_9PLEO|nr:hypothetical protein PtrM4_031180 [Pyrenophora tritici-repentis]
MNAVNACRLNDLDGKAGFWFVLQDLSVRTEGTFRLKLSLFDQSRLTFTVWGPDSRHHRVCAAANVEEAELESKGALCPDAQILQHEPEAGFAVEVVETTSVDAFMPIRLRVWFELMGAGALWVLGGWP